MAFKKRLRQYSKFDKRIFGRLEEKCRKETKFGKIANLHILILYYIVQGLKAFRGNIQNAILPLKTFVRTHITKPKVPVYPVMAWDLPISKHVATSPQRTALIIAELSIPQCTRYRVDQKAAAFRSLGYDIHIASFTDMELCLRQLPFATLVIFYRTPYWEPVQRLIKECKRLRIPTFYDIDDLVFDVEEYKKHPVLQRLPPKESKGLLAGAQSYQDCLKNCDHGIASTPVLATFMRKYQKGQVFILENALDELSIQAHEHSKVLQSSGDSKIVIGYGSGTKSHDEDFELAKDGLIRILREFSQVTLAIHGYLELSPEFNEFKHRIYRVPFLKADQYLHAVSRFTINIAPLTAGVFNDAKSNIKFLEASACGVPTVASPCAAFSQVIKDGENALLASTPEDWYRALKRLVVDPELRKNIANQASATAFRLYAPTETAKSLSNIFSVLPLPLVSTNARTKIMQVNCLFAPFSFGGATIVVERITTHLEKTCDVVIVTANTMGDLPELGCRRFNIGQSQVYSIRAPEEIWAPKMYDSPEFSEVFGRVLDRERPQVVHFHAIQMMGAGMLVEAYKRGIKIVVTAHDAWWQCERQFMLTEAGKYCGQLGRIDLKICAQCTGNADFTYRRMQKLDAMLSMSDLVLAPSTFHSNLVRANVSIPDRVKVNNNGTVMPSHPTGPRKLRADGFIRFAYLGGGNSTHKGYFFIKDIFERLNHKNYELIMTDIHQVIGHNGIDRSDWQIKGGLSIVQPFTHENIDKFFEGIDVLLFPSQLHESFGMTVREAILRNTWIISTRSGGVTDVIIEGENGNLVDIGDSLSFEKLIVQQLENPKRLEGFVAPGKEGIIDYAEQAAELKQMYESLLTAK